MRDRAQRAAAGRADARRQVGLAAVVYGKSPRARLQLPLHPARQVELHTPDAHDSAAVLVVLHVRPHLPQLEVVVPVSVSQPFDGSPTQCAKGVTQSSEQSPLHVPSMSLQQVPEQITDPIDCG